MKTLDKNVFTAEIQQLIKQQQKRQKPVAIPEVITITSVKVTKTDPFTDELIPDEITDGFDIAEIGRENVGRSAAELDGIRFGNWTIEMTTADIEEMMLDSLTSSELLGIDWRNLRLEEFVLTADGDLIKQ